MHISYKAILVAIAIIITIVIIYKTNSFNENETFSTPYIRNAAEETKKLPTISNVKPVIRNINSIGRKRQLLGFMSYSPDTKERLNKLIQRKATALDEELLGFLKDVMDAPGEKNSIKMSRPLEKTLQAKAIDIILNKMENGFFVEAGGLDGERSSNSIFFEKVRKWMGVLVEPDPYWYTQLLGKNRHCYSINGCISPYDYVSEISFKPSFVGEGKLALGNANLDFKVPCYPLLSILTALGVSKIDYFSLDVEGHEGVILESLPFDKLDITTLSVEYQHGDKKKYNETMVKQGFTIVKDIAFGAGDYIFVKNSFH